MHLSLRNGNIFFPLVNPSLFLNFGCDDRLQTKPTDERFSFKVYRLKVEESSGFFFFCFVFFLQLLLKMMK